MLRREASIIPDLAGGSYAESSELVNSDKLFSIQASSYSWFLEQGIGEALGTYGSVKQEGECLSFQFGDYSIGGVDKSEELCRKEHRTLSVPLTAEAQFICADSLEKRVQDVFMSDIPLITSRGTFIIEGSEVVIPLNFMRSSGMYVLPYDDGSACFAEIIPHRGAYLRIYPDRNNALFVRLDKRCDIPAVTLLCALGVGDSRESFLKVLGDSEMARQSIAQNICQSQEEALLAVYRAFRPEVEATVEAAQTLLNGLYFDFSRYDLAEYGRDQLNKKLGLSTSNRETTLSVNDILKSIQYLIAIHSGKSGCRIDDWNDYRHQRFITIGERLYDALATALLSCRRNVLQAMKEAEFEELVPANCLDLVGVYRSINRVFTSKTYPYPE